MQDTEKTEKGARRGYYGEYGGRYVPEALIPPLTELEEAMERIMPSREYRERLHDLLVNYCGRPTPVRRTESPGTLSLTPIMPLSQICPSR